MKPENRMKTGKGATQFKPGQSGNPGGRPKSYFGKYIRDATKDGIELVDFALSVFRDKKRNDKIRFEAMEFLADRGWGKAKQETESSDQFSEMIESMRKRYRVPLNDS